MATNPTKSYVDLDLNFNSNPITGDVTTNTGDMAPIGACRNLLQLNHYESPFNPSIGSNIEKLLFENADATSASALKKDITNTLTNYEQRVTISTLNIVADNTNNGFNISLVVFIQGNPNPVSISMFLKRVA
jgi:phage baseplate assembly protein W